MSACRAELQVPAWVTRSRHTATQLATWVNASQADPVLRWGVRLTPLLTLSITDIRTGLRLTTRGGVHATLLSTGLHVTDQQARLKQLLYDKVWPANAGKPSPGPAANAALGRTGFLAPEDDSCQLLGPLPFRASLVRRFVRDRRRIALGLGCHLPRSEEERRSQAQLQWRRLLELQQLQRASDFAMFLLSATHRSAAKILAAEPDAELQPFDYYRMLMQQYRREQDAVRDGPDGSAILGEESQEEEERGRVGSSGGGAAQSEAPPSPRTQTHAHETPSPLPSQSPSRRGQRHNRSSSLLSSSPNLLRSLSLGLRSTSAHAFAAMSKHVASGSRDASTAPGAVPAPNAPRPALDAHVLLPRRRTTDHGRTSSTSSFVSHPSAAPQGSLQTHPSGSTRFGPHASQVLRRNTTATMAQVLTSANNAHLANLIALRRSAATGNLPAGGSSIMGLGLASGIAGRASMRRIPEDARLGSFGSSGTRGLSSGMPSGGFGAGGLADSVASERTLQSTPSTGSAGGGGADRDAGGAGGAGHGGLPAYGSPWTTASSWKAGQPHPLGRSGSLGRSAYDAAQHPHQTQGGRGGIAWSASYARTPFGVAAAAAAAAAAQAAAAGESDERRRIDGVQRDAERKLSFVQAYRHMGKVQFPLGPTQQRVTYVHGMPLTAPCIAALVSKLPGSSSSAPGTYLRTSFTHLVSCVGVHSLGAILHMVVQVSQVRYIRVGKWVMATAMLRLQNASRWCI